MSINGIVNSIKDRLTERVGKVVKNRSFSFVKARRGNVYKIVDQMVSSSRVELTLKHEDKLYNYNKNSSPLISREIVTYCIKNNLKDAIGLEFVMERSFPQDNFIRVSVRKSKND